MGKQQRKYTPEFKREAVNLVETSTNSIRQIAKDLGIISTPFSFSLYQ
jgi:transposase-like protein